MRALVTGGAGYVGTELATSLSLRKDVDEVVVYDNLSRSNYNLFLGDSLINKDKVTFIKGDILDSRRLRKAIEGIDVVYHLAAKVTTPFADQGPHAFEQVNHWGTAEVVNAIEKSNVSAAFFTSSASVYGATTEEVDEFQGVNPHTFYGISKANGESHFARLFEKIQCITIRCGNIYGYSRSMRFDSVINKFAFQANFTGRISINGDGSQVRSFVHIDSVSDVLSNLPSSGFSSGIFNLIEETYSVNDIVNALETVYPNLERIYINQDIKLRQLRVRPNSNLNTLIDRENPRDLSDALSEFSTRFSF